MKRFVFILSGVLISLCSCIKNDLPYPIQQGTIVDIFADGLIGAPEINSSTSTIALNFEDSVDLSHVHITRLIPGNASHLETELDDYIDLTTPIQVVVSTYPGQKYQWTIEARQTLDLYFNVKEQIDKTRINADEHFALIFVPTNLPPRNVKVSSAKLGPLGSVIEPNPLEVDSFAVDNYFTVRYKGDSTQWLVRILQRDVLVETMPADAYATKAVFSGVVPQTGDKCGFRYRICGNDLWIEAENVVTTSDPIQATVAGLTPDTQYEYYVYSGDNDGSIEKFTTEKDEQLLNFSFDNWYKEGKTWFPNTDDQDVNHIWDSANKAATSAGAASSTVPEEEHVVKGKAVKMTSITAAGKFAAGNIYSGKFIKLEILKLGVTIHQGQPFNSRPVAFKGWYDYQPQLISKYAESPYESELGNMDQGQIYAILTDWSSRNVVNSWDPSTIINLDNDPSIIAIAKMDVQGTDGYVEFNMPFVYRRQGVKPSYVMICCTSSRYADNYTGGVGSTLYIDEFEFVY